MKKRGRKPKSKFYHVRWNVVGVNEEQAAKILGVTIDDVKRFDTDGAPPMAERLLLLWDRKHIGVDGWNGWLFSRGALVYKKQRWRPDMILDCRRCNDRLYEIECEISRLYTWPGLLKAFGRKIQRSCRRSGR